MEHVGRTIYLAGKIRPWTKGCPQDWRLDIVSQLEHTIDGKWMREWLLKHGVWPILPQAIFERFHYGGPFFTDLSDTWSGHGGPLDAPHGIDATGAPGYKHAGDTPALRRLVVRLCLEAIASADLVFAWIDSPECYGTIYELGYAQALGKRIAVRFAKGDFYAPMGRQELAVEDERAGGIVFDPFFEMWFPYVACQAQVCEEGPVEALKEVIAELGWDVFPDTFDSPLEAMFAEEWRAQSLHLLYPLVSQQPIKNGAYRIDFAFPRYQIGIELDGYTYHSDRDAFTRDRQRQREIEALGWHIIRFSGDELRHNITACVKEAARFLDIHKQRQTL
jgi:very-short-patch-repair endonuclease/nucleoside 2-deoxyribosyltransferase